MNSFNSLVTVILPLYNAEAYISNTVQSILDQTYTNIELIIIDDASIDNSIKIVQSFDDKRITLIQKAVNTGYTDSLNMGLELAKGKYIARMDADDIAHPERIAKQVAYMEANSTCVLCGTWITLIPGNKLLTYPILHEDIVAQLLRVNAICHPSVMMRKSTIDAFQLRYDRDYEPTEDYELWTRMALIGKLHNIPEALLQYRLHPGQISKTKNEIQKAHMRAVRLKFIQSHNKQNDGELFITSPDTKQANIAVWLKIKYDSLTIFARKEGILPTSSIRSFVAYQKKELIRNITKRENKYTFKVWINICTRCPEAFYYLGVKHTLTFLFRSISNSF